MLNKEKEERYQVEIICMDELVPSDHLLRKIDKDLEAYEKDYNTSQYKDENGK